MPFTCIPGGAPVQSCSSPVTVSTEGANQAVSGTVIDSASNSATATVTVNLDLTAPTLSITSPSNGSNVMTPYLVVTGTISDALSGVSSVTCNDIPAPISGTSFTCTVQMSLPSNTITVVGTDVAGNSTSDSITVGINMATPTSIQVTPGPDTLVLGNTQSFAAIDQNGVRRPDATWTVSDATIATLASDGSGTLTAVAVGQVTLTATVQGVSGQTTVTIVSGSSITSGTVLWKAPSVSGFATQQIFEALPTLNGPDLYAVDTDSSGDILVRAFQAGGPQLWQHVISANPNGSTFSYAEGDAFGGALLFSTKGIVDLSGPTGVQNWQYTAAGFWESDSAVGPDGTIYVPEAECSQSTNFTASCLDVINGTSGALNTQVQLPTSSHYTYNTDCNEGTFGETSGATTGPAAVGPDGVIVEVETSQYADTYLCSGGMNITYSENLSLLKLSPGGSVQYQTLNAYSQLNPDSSKPRSQPSDAVPDGNGGMLASYTKIPTGSYDYGDAYPLTIADIGAQGTVQSDFSTIDLEDVPLDDNLILGENGLAFVTDGTNVTAFSISFSPADLDVYFVGRISVVQCDNQRRRGKHHGLCTRNYSTRRAW